MFLSKFIMSLARRWQLSRKDILQPVRTKYYGTLRSFQAVFISTGFRSGRIRTPENCCCLNSTRFLQLRCCYSEACWKVFVLIQRHQNLEVKMPPKQESREVCGVWHLLRNGTRSILVSPLCLRTMMRCLGSKKPAHGICSFSVYDRLFRRRLKKWMINSRVRGLNTIAAQLRSAGISIESV